MTRPKAISIAILLLSVITIKPSADPPASSRFYFPHFVSGSGNATTFVISNSSAQDATVQLTAYGDDGSVLAMRSSRAIVAVGAQSQTQINAGDLFDVADGGSISGWLKAESTNPQISAWMLISLGGITGDKLDAIGASDEIAQKFAFSAVFGTGDTTTGIGLANPSSSIANVKATLYSSGKIVEAHNFQIPALGHRAWLLNGLFQSNIESGHVEIESDTGLVGLQTFSQPDRWSAAPMQLAQDASELTIPIPAGHFSQQIALANLQEDNVTLNVSAFGNDGLLLAGPITRLLNAHDEWITSVSELFGGPGSTATFMSIKTDVGLTKLFGTKPAVSGLVILRGQDSSALASFAIRQPQGRESIFSPVTNQSSGLLLNATTSGAAVRLSMVGANQKITGENDVKLGARSAASGTFVDLSKSTDRGNVVLLGSDEPLMTFQMESSDQGSFIIPGQTFKSRAVYSSGQLLRRISGGTVLSKDETVSISIPLNALQQDAAVELKVPSADSLPPLDSNRRLLAVTEFLPSGTQFRFPAFITMPLTGKRQPGASIPLQLIDPVTNQYQPSGSMALVGADGLSATALISHFSIFALTAEKRTVNITPSAITLQVGQTTQFTATVSGNGVQDVQWSVEGIAGGNASTGVIRQDGLFTAPAAVPPLGWVAVTAVSVDDPTASFLAQVTIRAAAAPSATDPAPAPAPGGGASDPIVLTGPPDPSCSGCHPYQ
ncbi:MAG TPA: DUF5719 family protein [Terriglobia bacterium]|nr:DUF5719 family protein [Terriglobia bacterium]